MLDPMERLVHNPTDGVYPAVADYAHAIELRGADRLVFVSGTMGLRPDGAAGSSLEEQLTLVWDNIAAILASADMTLDNVVRVTSYLTDREFAGPNADARNRALGRLVPVTGVVVATLSDDWLVELEVIAAA
jgi:enamine deaminase RidA (YjgF/YER057c/UK114 family)